MICLTSVEVIMLCYFRYVASSTHLTLTWGGFLFDLPVLFYQYGISDTPRDLTHVDCSDIFTMDIDGDRLPEITDNYTNFFNVIPLTNVEQNTLVNHETLSLTHYRSYQVVVMATDESGTCALTSDITTLDLSPPVEGTIEIEPEFHMVCIFFILPSEIIATL